MLITITITIIIIIFTVCTSITIISYMYDQGYGQSKRGQRKVHPFWDSFF